MFGLSQLTATGAVTLKDGRVEQRDLDAYVPPYMIDAPVTVDARNYVAATALTSKSFCPSLEFLEGLVDRFAR